MEKPRMASARKVAAGAAGLGLVATGIFGTSLFAAWSTNRSANQDFVGGQLNLAKINGTELNTAFGDIALNGGFAPGDTGTRYINLQNTGTLDYQTMKITATIGSITDALTGLVGGAGPSDTDFGVAAVAADFNVVEISFAYCPNADFNSGTKACGGAGWQNLNGGTAVGLNSISALDISAAIPKSPTIDTSADPGVQTSGSTNNVLRLSYAVPAGAAGDNANIKLEGASTTVLWEVNVTQRNALSNV